MTSLNVPILSAISAYHISLGEFQGGIFLKDQNKCVCLPSLTGRWFKWDHTCIWPVSPGEQHAVSLARSQVKRGFTFSEHHFPHDIWEGESYIIRAEMKSGD